jgi:hypothetical protein
MLQGHDEQLAHHDHFVSELHRKGKVHRCYLADDFRPLYSQDDAVPKGVANRLAFLRRPLNTPLRPAYDP